MAEDEKQQIKKKEASKGVNALATILQLSTDVQAVESIEELGFAVVNDTKKVVNYSNAVLWQVTPDKAIKIVNVSGVPDMESDAPFIVWCKKFIVEAQAKEWRLKMQDVSEHTAENLGISKELVKTWSSYAPSQLLYCPLISARGHYIGGLLLLRDSDWQKSEMILLYQLMQSYSFVWLTLLKTKKKKFDLVRKFKQKRVLYSVLIFLVLMLFMPIKLSVLAPAQIIPKDPFIVSSPLEGVVSKFHVAPNELVKSGQALFSLDDTTIRNNVEVAKQALNVAKADYRKTAQQAFSDAESKARMAVLDGEIQRRDAELAFNQEMLDRITIKAERDGVAVFDNPNDWIGKPVVVGERVMQLADAKNVELEVYLAVDDAIDLKQDADVRLFLNIDPLHPIDAHLTYASYEPLKSPADILSYRLLAAIEQQPGDIIPRIGLKGTAKVYGHRVSVFYYLTRRPIYVVRRFLGI